MNYWTSLQLAKQICGELGLPIPSSVVNAEVQSIQILSLMNSGGNELLLYYPWEQFKKEFAPAIVAGTPDYDLPVDWRYAVDQTQWDRTNSWPLLGPKSPQEWAWLKGSSVAALPRIRYRIQNDKFKLYPTPGQTYNITLEYVSSWWVMASDATTPNKEMIALDTDKVCYDPWLMVKFVKYKFYELKGFPTGGVQADFMRVFNSLTGKDTGAEILSLTPGYQSPYIGPYSIPDGSWQV